MKPKLSIRRITVAVLFTAALTLLAVCEFGAGFGSAGPDRAAVITLPHSFGFGPPPDGSRAEVIGRSVEGREIKSYRIGTGPKAVILFGGIHGGYEWNTVTLSEQLLEYFRASPNTVPDDVSLYILPNTNPDGVKKVTDGAALDEVDLTDANTTPGRFNANGVDLNRNFDHNWEPTARWFDIEVDAGTEPFSEPETRALRDFILRHDPELVIAYHSAANGIYPGGHFDGYDLAREPGNVYSEASGYPMPYGPIIGYPVTGDASNYLATEDIPAITVELATHEDPEFQQNLAGVLAVLEYVSAD